MPSLLSLIFIAFFFSNDTETPLRVQVLFASHTKNIWILHMQCCHIIQYISFWQTTFHLRLLSNWLKYCVYNKQLQDFVSFTGSKICGIAYDVLMMYYETYYRYIRGSNSLVILYLYLQYGERCFPVSSELFTIPGIARLVSKLNYYWNLPCLNIYWFISAIITFCLKFLYTHLLRFWWFQNSDMNHNTNQGVTSRKTPEITDRQIRSLCVWHHNRNGKLFEHQ